MFEFGNQFGVCFGVNSAQPEYNGGLQTRPFYQVTIGDAARKCPANPFGLVPYGGLWGWGEV